ncbi:hypothetical protein E2C01_048837 [Portunus trituberculatus]|uniref:Uncharacterized protein n=1 Tax=Portunus trituberculatus TaxID=210409 RepID=A0A5B7GCL6_PORTR|nr:hypothetical protein [Portunus trituberculatus]
MFEEIIKKSQNDYTNEKKSPYSEINSKAFLFLTFFNLSVQFPYKQTDMKKILNSSRKTSWVHYKVEEW